MGWLGCGGATSWQLTAPQHRLAAPLRLPSAHCCLTALKINGSIYCGGCRSFCVITVYVAGIGGWARSVRCGWALVWRHAPPWWPGGASTHSGQALLCPVQVLRHPKGMAVINTTDLRPHSFDTSFISYSHSADTILPSHIIFNFFSMLQVLMAA